MRNKILKTILDETPEDVRIFVRKHSDIVVRVYQLMREKGWTQQKLAEKLEKTPSEVSKWLNGEHNFTLRSLAKLEAELGADIIYVPKRDSSNVQQSGSLKSISAKRSQYQQRFYLKASNRVPHLPNLKYSRKNPSLHNGRSKKTTARENNHVRISAW